MSRTPNREMEPDSAPVDGMIVIGATRARNWPPQFEIAHQPRSCWRRGCVPGDSDKPTVFATEGAALWRPSRLRAPPTGSIGRIALRGMAPWPLVQLLLNSQHEVSKGSPVLYGRG